MRDTSSLLSLCRCSPYAPELCKQGENADDEASLEDEGQSIPPDFGARLGSARGRLVSLVQTASELTIGTTEERQGNCDSLLEVLEVALSCSHPSARLCTRANNFDNFAGICTVS